MVYDVHHQSWARKHRRALVWLNGVEVTERSFYADPRRSVVRLYKHVDDRPYIDHMTGNIAKEERRGRVRVKWVKS